MDERTAGPRNRREREILSSVAGKQGVRRSFCFSELWLTEPPHHILRLSLDHEFAGVLLLRLHHNSGCHEFAGVLLLRSFISVSRNLGEMVYEKEGCVGVKQGKEKGYADWHEGSRNLGEIG
ncbi:hypothetical protein HanRHA438_Chr10g0466811 [Helianthus annuus]|uniref:Uncharacterized protein n=1 Tax=Helianthus annuus TaxID=4232 RepID=A0A9K3I0F4_HELAN|nr:hypothetical protein HanXRQr2_Chr10g0454001 [Helianthus annuus]KAJ0514755.1 hypothetical protein HanHA300_Chr10g0373151 [Helianthus annuus]KAJ0530909.1 hypothetical protein HanHA89_Chr10g0395271 [Helianthus annuus]KAJ0701134.1 hypothetical protein HanOQP8_Chr10g0376041 [Helianthus annuus]KAJ0880761.1 hypothetical protein HanRHA438_Chr10g0466811 [Helianthus annuus]